MAFPAGAQASLSKPAAGPPQLISQRIIVLPTKWITTTRETGGTAALQPRLLHWRSQALLADGVQPVTAPPSRLHCTVALTSAVRIGLARNNADLTIGHSVCLTIIILS